MVYGPLTASLQDGPCGLGLAFGVFDDAASAFSDRGSAARRHAARSLRHDQANRGRSRAGNGGTAADRGALVRLRGIECAAPGLSRKPVERPRDGVRIADAAVTTSPNMPAAPGRRPATRRPSPTA